MPQKIKSYFKTSTKRTRSLSESGSSPTLKKMIGQFDMLDSSEVEARDVAGWVAHIGNTMNKVLETLDTMSSSINNKLEEVKNECSQQISAVRTEFDAYKGDTNAKIQNLSTTFDNHKIETDRTISGLQNSLEIISKMYEDEKAINAHLEGRVQDLEVSENHHVQLFRSYRDDLDALAQYGRRDMLLLHGVPETEGEDTTAVFVEEVKKIGVTIHPLDVSRSHRLGRSGNGKNRPIIVKFFRYSDRARVYAAKKRLKGQKRMITESLTATRVARLKRAIERYPRNAWTQDGEIYIKINGTKTRYTEPDDYSEIYDDSHIQNVR